MKVPSREVLARLGSGESIASVCELAGLTREAFDAWWNAEIAGRVPAMAGSRAAAVHGPVRIDRDAVGIPHIHAHTDSDVFFGFGYAMAADRLFQMDYLRRKGRGRLAEVLGPDVLDLDRLARTVGLGRIAEAEWETLGEETKTLLHAFSTGVNALIAATRDAPPIEFDLLDYRPEPWSPVDCLVIESEFRWYLTGRFPVIVMPELSRRALGDGPLYQAFPHCESDEESIVPPGSYRATPVDGPREAVGISRAVGSPVRAGTATGDPDSALGSNDYPYDMAGTWSDDLRAQRIRQRIEAVAQHSRRDVATIQFDTLSLRAAGCLPQLLAVLAGPGAWSEEFEQARSAVQAIAALRSWDLYVEPDRVGATIFNVFFATWIKAVVETRFTAETAVLLAGGAAGLAPALLADNLAGWFDDEQARRRAIIASFAATLEILTERLGTEISHWTWGRLHRLDLRHVLSGRGELGQLLDHGGVPVGGDMTTVCNTGQGPDFDAPTGAGFRMIAELDPRAPAIWALDVQGQSGHPGSPHYSDQVNAWLGGRYHFIPLDRPAEARSTLRLEPF